MASEGSEKALTEKKGAQDGDEDQFADSLSDKGVSPTEVFNARPIQVPPAVLTSNIALADFLASKPQDTGDQVLDSNAADSVGAEQTPVAATLPTPPAAPHSPKVSNMTPLIAAYLLKTDTTNNCEPDPIEESNQNAAILLLASAAADAAANPTSAQIVQSPTKQQPLALAQGVPLPMAPTFPKTLQQSTRAPDVAAPEPSETEQTKPQIQQQNSQVSHLLSVAAPEPPESEQTPKKKPQPLSSSVASASKPAESEQPQKPPPKKRKPTNVPVIPISPIETQVCKAARLMAVELQHGGWPEAKPGAHLRAAAALEDFAKTIFLPNLLHSSKEQNGVPSNKRIFLATMLALREVLAQNASQIFQMEDVPSLNNTDEQRDKITPGSKRRKQQNQEEEEQYMAQLFATAAVFATIQSLPEAESLMQSFKETMDAYDTCDHEFASRMEPLNGRHQGVMPTAKKLKSEENVAWKVSYNRAREVHPVPSRNERRSEQQSEPSHSIEIPKPNAVFVSMIEMSSNR